MPEKRFPPGELLGTLCRADGRLGQGKTIADAVTALGAHDSRWRQEHRGVSVAQAWPLKEAACAVSGGVG
ncbi:MAG TPA: hypothetical protein VLM91_06015 [Candidatus Methylomirabilis sp.]|nr:hypothetical protein [Candidatus Methylomirabilis sp.]